MKKSKSITLILVAGLLGCHSHKEPNRLYMRTDSVGPYTPGTSGYHGFYAFRPYGSYYDGGYGAGGFYSGRFVREGYSNAGVHSSGEGISRGGFGGEGGFHAGS